MSETIEKLVKTIKSRKGNDVKSSYTSFLLSKGNDHCLNKFKEEVAELEDAIKNKKNTVHETADVIYHLLVTLESAGINFDVIITELKKRESISRQEHIRKCWSLIWDLIQIGFVLGVHSFAPRYFQNQFKKRLIELNKSLKEIGI